MAKLLSTYPDKNLAKFLVDSFKKGFPLGTNRFVPVRPPVPPMKDALKNIKAFRKLVQKEVEAGRFLGPFKEDPFKDIVCSPLNLVPKAGEPG